MIVGHFGAGFFAKAIAPELPLFWLVFAGQLPDIALTLMEIAGISQIILSPRATAITNFVLSQPNYTHCLFAMLVVFPVLASAVFLVFMDFKKSEYQRYSRAAVALLVYLTAASHGVMDLVAFNPVLPIFPNSSTFYGMGLVYNKIACELVDAGLLIVGVALYAHQLYHSDIYVDQTRPRHFIALAMLVFLDSAIVFGSPELPPPENKLEVKVSFVVLLAFNAVLTILGEAKAKSSNEREKAE